MIENSIIGYDPFTEKYFTGLIDDVHVYDRTLTVEEVGKLASE